MLPLSAHLPSRPEPAHLSSRPGCGHVEDSGISAIAATGSQPVPSNSAKQRKKKKHQRAAHDFSLKRPELPKKPLQDLVFTYFQREAERKDGARCVFLLWGSDNAKNTESFESWAVDVPITDLESEDKIFALLAKRYKELGFLRRCFSFRKFSKLKPVTFQIIRRCSERFSVFVKPLDLDSLAKDYSERREKALTSIKSMIDVHSDFFPDNCCDRDSSGKYEHCGACPSKFPTDATSPACPVEELYECGDQISWIERIQSPSYLSHSSSNTDSARSRDILHGFQGHDFTIYYDLPAYRFQTHLELDGLYVETALDSRKCLCVLLGILICVVGGGKLLWGSWEITFGAGSFIVALPMLAFAVIGYYQRPV